MLTFTSSGAKRLETLGLNYTVGDKVELNIDSDKSLVAFNKRDSQYSVNLSRYGKVDSRRFQIYSKKLAGEGLKEGEYRVEEPKKSQSEFDFLLYPVSES